LAELSAVVNVSVVIPCYRCKGSIARAVESVFAQTLRPAEVILVDDCSPDDTLEQLHAEAKRYPPGWVKVIALKKNGGPGNARNAGWAEATGKYVAFLDSDDSWHVKKTELQYQWLEQHPEVDLLGQHFAAGQRSEPSIDDVRFIPVTGRQLLLSNRFSTSSVMIRQDVKYRFKQGMRYCEDYQLWCDICFGGGACFNVDYPLVNTFKPVYGDSGLSGQLWRMERGELAVHLSLLKRRYIGLPACLLAVSWSLGKFVRRVINSSVRRTL